MALKDIFLSKEAQIRFPNVDEVLTLGYAAHVADDDSSGETARAIAKQVLCGFAALKPHNDTEAAYLQRARGIVLSMGRGITRKKQEWERSLREAEKDREVKLSRVLETTTNNFLLGLVWKLLGPIILGLAGYVTAQVISYFIPVKVSTQTGHLAPAVLMGLVFVFVGRWVSFLLYNNKRDAIELECRSRSFQAQLAYDYGKLNEYRLYREHLCEAWLEYTGEEYPPTASYGLVMIGDAETRKRIEQQRDAFGRTNLWILRRIVRLVRRSKKKVIDERVSTPVVGDKRAYQKQVNPATEGTYRGG